MANKLAMRERSLLENQQELNDLNRNLAQESRKRWKKRLMQERLMARHDRLAAIGEMIGAIARNGGNRWQHLVRQSEHKNGLGYEHY
jgi:type IV secretory pathway TrbF-like protein